MDTRTVPVASTMPDAGRPGRRWKVTRKILGNWSVRLGGSALALLAILSLLAPILGTIDPTALDPSNGNVLPGVRGEFTTMEGESNPHWFIMGTDSLGRDIWSRTLYGGRVSIAVGLSVAALAVALGLAAGAAAGYFRWLDGVLMRVMDGVMAIPGILFAVTIIALFGASLSSVILAITLPEVPRVARLVRAIVLGVRGEAYVEAAISLATPTWRIITRHVLPNALAPLIVQGTYVCASAILVEAILSFLGIGVPADVPTWGNIMAEGRSQFNQYPHNVLFPGIFLATTILAVNVLGDGLRDTLDPKFNKRGG